MSLGKPKKARIVHGFKRMSSYLIWVPFSIVQSLFHISMDYTRGRLVFLHVKTHFLFMKSIFLNPLSPNSNFFPIMNDVCENHHPIPFFDCMKEGVRCFEIGGSHLNIEVTKFYLLLLLLLSCTLLLLGL